MAPQVEGDNKLMALHLSPSLGTCIAFDGAVKVSPLILLLFVTVTESGTEVGTGTGTVSYRRLVSFAFN